jgi:hypothetical protein
MAIARIEEFINKLKPLTKVKDIKALCHEELDYLRRELKLKTIYSKQGYPVGVEGDARRLKQQVSIYRNAIRQLECNSKNSTPVIVDGESLRLHKALKSFNLADYEKKDVSSRDRKRVKKDKRNRPSFDAITVIDKSLELLDSDSYISKITGLYLLTGRRHVEILVSGKFEEFDDTYSDDSITKDWLDLEFESALFSGQAKRKSKEDIPYNIPLLAPFDIIENSIEWLRVNKPHKLNERPKGSKELGLKVRKIFQDSDLLPPPSGKDLYLNPHNLRSAYCAICWQLFRYSDLGDNCTEDLFIKEIMGHLEDSTESAQAYLDYELDENQVDNLVEKYYG